MTDRLGRRRLLALVGVTPAVALAGCAGPLLGSGPPTVDGDRLRELADRDPPTVPETLPVPVEESFVDDQRAVARSRLDEVPAPFDEEQVPNEAFRRRLNERYESAREHLRRVPDAPTPFERLGRANYARTAAHETWAVWRATRSELTAADLRTSLPTVRADVEAFATGLSYAGDDPVRAAVVYAEVEREARGGRNWLSAAADGVARVADRPFELAEVAVNLERARVTVVVGSYLADRLRETTDDASALRGRFDASREELRRRVGERAEESGLPDGFVDDPTTLVDRGGDATTGVHALGELANDTRRRVDDALDDTSPDPTLATGCLVATRALVHLRAFDDLRERIESGDALEIETAADVARLREDAVAAVNEARSDDRAPVLIRAVLPALARGIRQGDERFERARDSETVEAVSRDAAEYVVAAETCRALPPVAADAAAAVRSF